MADPHTTYSIVVPTPTSNETPEALERALESQRQYIERTLRTAMHNPHLEVRFVDTGECVEASARYWESVERMTKEAAPLTDHDQEALRSLRRK